MPILTSRTFRSSRLASECWRDVIATDPGSPKVPYQSSNLFFARAAGAFLVDLDGQDYVDFNNGSGSVFLGHGHVAVNAALLASLQAQATTLTGPQEKCALLARRLLRDLPVGYLVSFFTTGTEAVRAAIDVARQVTGRKVILSAGYHGWESTWRASPNGPFTKNVAGVVDFLYLLDAAERYFERHPRSVAAAVISPHPEYFSAKWYKRLSELVANYGSILICDEVKQGYRHASGPLLHQFGVSADIYTFSKIIGNGHRISAVCGAEPLMHCARGLTHTSVLDALHATAAVATLQVYDVEDAPSKVLQNGDALLNNLIPLLQDAKLPIEIVGNGRLFQFVVEDKELESALYDECLAAGIIFTPCDAQTPSLAFDAEVRVTAEARIRQAINGLAYEYRHLRRTPISLRSRLEAACRVLHGLPEFAHSGSAKLIA